jgi:hypothetical protein
MQFRRFGGAAAPVRGRDRTGASIAGLAPRRHSLAGPWGVLPGFNPAFSDPASLFNRFNGFPPCEETIETVEDLERNADPAMNRGANESGERDNIEKIESGPISRVLFRISPPKERDSARSFL